MLKRTGPKRDEVTREWRKLHNEELNDLYSSPNFVRVVKSRRMRWVGHAARMGERRGVYRVLVGKPEGKRLLGRPNLTFPVIDDGKFQAGWLSLGKTFELRTSGHKGMLSITMLPSVCIRSINKKTQKLSSVIGLRCLDPCGSSSHWKDNVDWQLVTDSSRHLITTMETIGCRKTSVTYD